MSDSKFKVWILASRPKTLWAAVSPVIIGTAMAFGDGKAHWLSAFLAAFAAVMIQIGANFSNDYFDYIKGADEGERLGPTRATQAGLVRPQEMKWAFILAYSLAAVAGVYLLFRGGWPILMIGVFSILAGIFYTAGPFPLGYIGLGDVFVLIFFGLLAVGGTYYVQALAINRLVIIAGIAPGLFSMAILTVNNLRDINNDRKAGKKTLAVRWGKNFARAEYLFSMFIACLVPVILFFLTTRHIYALASSIVFFFALPLIKIIYRNEPGAIFNQVLAQTGKLLFFYSLIFSLGWIL
ncbi:MAG: 1,4-dihydroxy-2-naphthoate polyprenyltransferase [Actinobacteria bacterium]|nr:1,4-dihydroxy-2-naphthoate polyprenyltransferase [Actinomycetota bacterium]